MTSRSKSIIKYIFAAILLAAILYHTNIHKISAYLGYVSPASLAVALLLVTCAQIAAAMRMRYFFRASGYHLNAKFAIMLFYVGAFYNFLLPGGIGGDAYKVMLARKRLDMPTMKGIKLMVADRASGLCVVMMMMFAALFYAPLPAFIPYAKALLAAGTAITLFCYLFLSRILLGQSAKTMFISLHYSLYSQSLWVATLGVLWHALGTGKHFIEYVALYCAASITALIPVSVGGLGVKESTYYYGAMLFRNYSGTPVDGELGIALSLCIFALSFIASLPGILWLHKVGSTQMHLLHPAQDGEQAAA